jgi:homeobox-leucine zipper protein
MQAVQPVFTFANQSGLDMLETTLVALQDITLEKVLDAQGRANLRTELPSVMEQVRTHECSPMMMPETWKLPSFLLLHCKLTEHWAQGFACIPGGLCVSSLGRPVSYEKVLAWKVLDDVNSAHCTCFMFVNWSFV